MKQAEKVLYNAQAVIADLQSCCIKRDLQWGKLLHAKAVESQTFSMYVMSALIKLYAKCSFMVEARLVFEGMQEPDVVSWNVLILGYAENGEGSKALELFSKMKGSACGVDSLTYVAAFKACTSLAENGKTAICLEWGKAIHSEVGCHLDHYVQSSLIQMYAKCGSMVYARQVFDGIPEPNVVSWTALVMGYAENGDGLIALELFDKMKCGCAPNSVTYVAILKACTSLAVNGKNTHYLERGKEIHAEIGCHLNSIVHNTLIDMYAKCKSMADAHRVFDGMKRPDVVSWNALLLGYADNGEGYTVLDLFSRMKLSGTQPNRVTYIAALKGCIALKVNGAVDCLERGREIHLEIGSHLNHSVQSMLINMYSKCGSMVLAREVFDSINIPDVVSWTALLMGYAENGEGAAALELFSKMKASGCSPTSVTYVAVLKSCISLVQNGETRKSCLERGQEIHLEIGSRLDHYVESTLVDMYAKCGSMLEARHVFDRMQKPNVVAWTALILGYVENGDGRIALELFARMKACGCSPDSVTYIVVLKACICLALNGETEQCLKRGRKIHLEIGFHLNHSVQTTLIDMYSKCNSMEDAHHVFDNIYKQDVVSWNVLLLGYAENGESLTTLSLFCKMKAAAFVPDSITYIAALKACSSTGNLAFGRKLHLQIREFNARVVTCLVDFYAKCGSIEEAKEVFDLHPKGRDITTWNALLTGYGSFDVGSVFDFFKEMEDGGFKPDAVTFLSMLLCCSHAGFVQKAEEYFDAMPRYGITPAIMHYNCMVDVLGRANQLNEVISILRKTPCTPDVVTWRAVLGASCKWKNVDIGRLAFQSLVDIDHKNVSAYVVMGHLFMEGV